MCTKMLEGIQCSSVFVPTNSCIRGKTAAAPGICKLQVSWRTSPNLRSEMGAHLRLRLGPCSLFVYTLVGSAKTLYVKFVSTIYVTFFEGKRGGG